MWTTGTLPLLILEVIEMVLTVQRQWMYLEVSITA